MTKVRALYLPAAGALALLLCGLSAPAAAEDGGFYLDANGGPTLSTYSQSSFNNALNNTFGGNLTVASSSLDKPKWVWWAGGGYMFTPYLGIDASYLDLGKLKYKSSGTQATMPSPTAISAAIDVTSGGPALALVGVLPLWNAWSLTGRAGVYMGKSDTDYTSNVGGTVNVGSESVTAGSLLLGLGGAYALSAHCAVRLDFLYINDVHEKVLDHSFNVSAVTLGFAYAF